MDITSTEAMWFLPFAIPIGLWAAWTDMREMKIKNTTVMVLAAVFLVIGLVVLPIEQYLWRLLQLVVVLVIGFGLNAIGAIGGGDAKFAAAMAPFVALGDLPWVLYVFAFILLVTFFVHRVLRRIPPVRRLTPDWKSWDHAAFPMGLALGSLLITYIAAGVVSGA